ncbi:MAG: RsmB/NOP family class I SAM-dependent RNA methyltransferase [Lachnospiraceae bacterium]|nr:RsmB/NOP family class I SAM-dependent RNA methyltransferase [Lachnospiraceae bacterium]
MLPEGFKNRMMSLLGEEEYRLFEESLSEEPIQGLRVNPLKGSEEGRRKLEDLFALRKISYEDTGYYFDPETFPGRRPYHDAGAYYIQDPGAMVPGAVLCERLFGCDEFCGKNDLSGGKDGLWILDLCAAPGGKSTQIASAMAGRGIIVSNEINRSRAEILSRNIERMGIVNAIVLNETPERLSERFTGCFDAVIVDAPCSGEGMFRKDAEAITQWSEEGVDVCVQRQTDILQNAYMMLRPGGVMVYSTCTFESAEDEDMVKHFMSEHQDIKLTDMSFFKKKADGIRDGIDGLSECARMWPMYFAGEGQFAALLEKSGDGERALPSGGFENSSKIKDIRPLETFLNDSLSKDAASRILKASDRFRVSGDNLYLMPEDAPALSGLKVLRCGLHVGTFKKDRFEPAHALALILNEQDVKLVQRVSEDEAESFVKGMTLEGEGNGWCLVSLDGFSLGWGKASGGRVKNHYPRGLRIPG